MALSQRSGLGPMHHFFEVLAQFHVDLVLNLILTNCSLHVDQTVNADLVLKIHLG